MAREASPGPLRYRLWCGGLHKDITEDEIRQAVEPIAEVKAVMLRTRRFGATGRQGLGGRWWWCADTFCFIQFTNQKDMDKAIEKLDQSAFLGDRVCAQPATADKKKSFPDWNDLQKSGAEREGGRTAAVEEERRLRKAMVDRRTPSTKRAAPAVARCAAARQAGEATDGTAGDIKKAATADERIRRTGATGIPTAAMDGERSVGATIDKVRAISATPASATPPPATPAPGATATSATSRPATAATATAATAAATRGTRGTATATRGRAGAANTKNTRREGEIVALEVSRWGEREKEDGEKAELE
eukprot:g33172.t1